MKTSTMRDSRRRPLLGAAVLLLLIGQAPIGLSAARDEKGKKPSLSLKVAPNLAQAPAKVRATATLTGGDDSEEYYCLSVEWDWGDDTRSESSRDCAPFEKGRSEIVRRFTADHTYQYSGQYKLTLRLKRKDRVVLLNSTNVQVQAGLDGR